jgi:hypothetical protein
MLGAAVRIFRAYMAWLMSPTMGDAMSEAEERHMSGGLPVENGDKVVVTVVMSGWEFRQLSEYAQGSVRSPALELLNMLRQRISLGGKGSPKFELVPIYDQPQPVLYKGDFAWSTAPLEPDEEEVSREGA